MRFKRNGKWGTPWMTQDGVRWIPYTEDSAAKEIADAEAKGDGTIVVKFNDGDEALVPFNIMPTVADLMEIGGMAAYVQVVVREWHPGRDFGSAIWLPWARTIGWKGQH